MLALQQQRRRVAGLGYLCAPAPRCGVRAAASAGDTMTIDVYYTSAAGEVVMVDGAPRWHFTFPCEHRHGTEQGALECALRRGEPLIAEFTERRAYGPEGAEPLVEVALTRLDDLPMRTRDESPQRPDPDLVDTDEIFVPAIDNLTSEQELRVLDALLERLKREAAEDEVEDSP
jgi:hypothetical protein